VTEEKVHLVLELLLPIGIIQKPTLISYFSTKRIINVLGFKNIVALEILGLIHKFLHLPDYDNENSCQGPRKFFKIYLNRKFQ
jgi:hypothetical protein